MLKGVVCFAAIYSIYEVEINFSLFCSYKLTIVCYEREIRSINFIEEIVCAKKKKEFIEVGESVS